MRIHLPRSTWTIWRSWEKAAGLLSLTIQYCQKACIGIATSHVFISHPVSIWKSIQTDAPISPAFIWKEKIICKVSLWESFMCKLWYNTLSLPPSFSSWLCWTDKPGCYLQSSYRLEAALQVFAHCPPAWPSYDLNSSFLLRSRKQGWYPASLYSLTYLLALQTRVPGNVSCKGDGCDLGTKHRLLKDRHWEFTGWTLPQMKSGMNTSASLGQESDKCSYSWKSHLGSLRVMPSSLTHFKTNWRAFGQK